MCRSSIRNDMWLRQQSLFLLFFIAGHSALVDHATCLPVYLSIYRSIYLSHLSFYPSISNILILFLTQNYKSEYVENFIFNLHLFTKIIFFLCLFPKTNYFWSIFLCLLPLFILPWNHSIQQFSESFQACQHFCLSIPCIKLSSVKK